MRLFVAVDVPEHLKDAIENDVVGRLRGGVSGARWTRPEGRHLTLKFLGNVDESRVDSIAAVLSDVAVRHRGFDAAFDEIGAFPNLRRPRVLWVGLGRGNEELARIASDLDEGFVRLGFEAEGRPFRGHLTLARFPKPAVAEVPSVEVPDESFGVRELIVFDSKLHPRARYTALERFALR